MPRKKQIQRNPVFQRRPPLYGCGFEVRNRGLTTRILNDQVFKGVAVGDGGPQLVFVGYQIKKGNNRIDAEFLNLLVQGQ